MKVGAGDLDLESFLPPLIPFELVGIKVLVGAGDMVGDLLDLGFLRSFDAM